MDSRFYRDEYNILKNTNIKFSDNFAKVAYAGQTVTYLNMQLAYFMGFKNIYLIGVDFDYVLPKDVIKKGKYGNPMVMIRIILTLDILEKA